VKELVNTRPVTPEGDQGTIAPPPFGPLFPSIYHVVVEKIVLKYQQQQETVTDIVWTGTGFLLSDGRFVTARHIIENWFYYRSDDEIGIALNKIANNGGSISVYFKASAPGGETFTFTNSDFKCNRSTDETLTANDNDGNTFVLRKARLEGGGDWAVMQTNRTGGLVFDTQIAQTLPQQQKLHLLGYPLGLGANSGNLSPIYGNCMVSSTGVSDGYILVTDRNFEHGNSGGPVFYLDPNRQSYVVVGLVSAGAGSSTGFIIPISNL
jgi:S1-C subfamily serine protease